MSAEDITVVLVHGAWADGSSWGGVISALKSQDINAVAAPLPLTSLSNDVMAVERTIARIDGPVVLAGHAYAGAVIGETHSEKVKALVYVAALAPDEGERVADVFYRAESHPKAPKLAPDENSLIWLPDEAFANAFAQNASTEIQGILAAVQRPIAVACISTPVGIPAWRNLPSWYLLAEDDVMIAPGTQRFMAERMKAQIRTHRVDHAPSITAPSIVVEIIQEAIRGAK
jgi:pimeloyl-ACP methyl ester carboxylesterase